MNNRPQLAGTSNHGFTLLEILLVLALLLLLFGAAVFEFNSMGRGASLSDGADRLESLFRFARSEAERTGREGGHERELQFIFGVEGVPGAGLLSRRDRDVARTLRTNRPGRRVGSQSA